MTFEELKHSKGRRVYQEKHHSKVPAAMFFTWLVFVGACGSIENGSATSVSYILLVVSLIALLGMAYITRSDEWEI